MEINSKIFRAYDIRGIYPKEINENAAYLIGRAFVRFLKKKHPKVVVSRDGRLSSPSLFKFLTKGILEEGADIIDVGLATSPMFYFAVARFKYDGGIQISASHNPPKYNGFKIVREKAIPIGATNGLKEIEKIAANLGKAGAKPGKITKKKILEDYLKANLKGFNPGNFKNLEIIIDTANSVSGVIIPGLFKKSRIKITHLFKKIDPGFPNHNPDPTLEENVLALKNSVLKKKADLGIAFDGDGDRIIFIDEKGQKISGDLITALVATLVLKKNKGARILYTVPSGNIIKEKVRESGGVPVVGRVGHFFIKEKMRKEGIVFAGEMSGHYYHKDYYFCEAPVFVLFSVLEEMKKQGRPFSEIIRPFKKYYNSGEINLKVENKNRALEALENKFKGGKVLKIDGLRIDFSGWWFNARPSNTEPLLRMVIEAKTKEMLEERKKELISLVTESH